MKTARQRRSRALALIGCVTVVATFVAYSIMLQQQANSLGEPPVGVFGNLQGAPTWLLVAFAATAAASGTASCVRFGRARKAALLATALVLTAVGLIGMFSVGLPLILAAGMMFGAAATDGGHMTRPQRVLTT